MIISLEVRGQPHDTTSILIERAKRKLQQNLHVELAEKSISVVGLNKTPGNINVEVVFEIKEHEFYGG